MISAAVSSSTHRVKTATEKAKYLGVFLLLWSLSKRAVLLPPTTEDLDFVGYIKSDWTRSSAVALSSASADRATMTTLVATRTGPYPWHRINSIPKLRFKLFAHLICHCLYSFCMVPFYVHGIHIPTL